MEIHTSSLRTAPLRGSGEPQGSRDSPSERGADAQIARAQILTPRYKVEFTVSRRNFLRLTGIGSVLFGSGLLALKFSEAGGVSAAVVCPSNLVVGLEIGTSKVCAVVAERSGVGITRILGLKQLPSRGVRRGEIINVEAAAESVREVLVQLESMSGAKIREVILAVRGRDLETSNGLGCLQRVGFHAREVVFKPLASAEAVLSSEQKMSGALVIDLGAGATGYAVYVDGAVVHSGCRGVGGGHLTNDLSMGLRIPFRIAETLKIDEGDVQIDRWETSARISLRDSAGFVGREIDRNLVNKIIYLRVRETFEGFKALIEGSGVRLSSLLAGVHLTGGGALLRGIEGLTEDIFRLPASVGRVTGTIAGSPDLVGNPQYSCAIGLVKSCPDPQERSGPAGSGQINS